MNTPHNADSANGAPRLARRIAHCDLDTFFVAVERLRDPSLIGKPVLVGGTGPRSVVATASYEARVFGCHSAQPMGQALRLCPQAIVVSPDFNAYRSASHEFHEVLHDASPLVESAGLDEAYIDLTGVGEGTTAAREAGEAIRAAVKARTGLAVSIGIAGSKTTAKVTSDRAKPDGLIEVPLGGDAEFLAPLPLRDLPFVGPKLATVLQAAGVRTIGQVASLDAAWLRQRFGTAGASLAERARGIDRNEVRALPRVPVSVSREVTFGSDVTDLAELMHVLRSHADRVGGDLRRAGRRARTVTLKVRWPDFTTVSRSRTASRPVQSTAQLLEIGQAMLDEVFASEGRHPVRLIGLGATKLFEDVVQLGFEDAPVQRDEQLDKVVDELRDRFGEGAVQRGRPGRTRR
ncbi:MAG: DNA polymerase IV [Chloroflexi bacterium]|nr:MAG: DNA polymerase IV [Chloroflexota bacterium]